jgi:polar amino acid transport system substrate-binding protein
MAGCRTPTPRPSARAIPVWLNWVNTVYREAMLGVDFDLMKASYQKWFGIDLPTPTVGFPQEFT